MYENDAFLNEGEKYLKEDKTAYRVFGAYYKNAINVKTRN